LVATHSWFSPSQHGFRAGLSTETASLSLIKLIEGNKCPLYNMRSFVQTNFQLLKSVFMVFSSKRTLPSLSLKVDNECVARSHSCLYLGLTIDDKLSWNTHISNKCAAVKKNFCSSF
jgi:hypothetical protein